MIGLLTLESKYGNKISVEIAITMMDVSTRQDLSAGSVDKLIDFGGFLIEPDAPELSDWYKKNR